jgi:hypothetical protein
MSELNDLCGTWVTPARPAKVEKPKPRSCPSFATGWEAKAILLLDMGFTRDEVAEYLGKTEEELPL